MNESITTLRNRTDRGGKSWNIVLYEIYLGEEWWQRGHVPEAHAEQDDASNQQRNTRAGCEYEGHQSGNLHCVTAIGDHSSISTTMHSFQN